MATTLDIALVNKSSTDTVYAYVTGLQIDNNNAWYLLQADGQTVYNPSSPSSPGAPLAVDCAIPVGAIGSSRTIKIPHTAGGRIYLSYDATLTFLLNPGPALVEPSVTNPADPNTNLEWGFCEFTWNAAQLYANISYVDFVGIPIALDLLNTAGATQSVTGIPSTGLQTVADGLTQQGQSDGKPWGDLVYRRDGKIVRILSPNQGMVQNPSMFSGYYEPYVDQVWSRYSNGALLTIGIQPTAVTGTVTGDGQMTFSGDDGLKFPRPGTGDIFSANSGPFTTGNNPTRNAIIPVLNAELNRSTPLQSSTLPAPRDTYYKEAITNYYGKIVHAANVDQRGYTTPYDDVSPADGGDQSGAVHDPNPQLFTVTVGGTQFGAAPASAALGHDQQPL